MEIAIKATQKHAFYFNLNIGIIKLIVIIGSITVKL